MGPPAGAPQPEGSSARQFSEGVPKSGADLFNSSYNQKRRGQHEDYHKNESKRRNRGAQEAAKVQEHATQLVEQCSVPDRPNIPRERHGTLAKAEHRQEGNNQIMESKPWAGASSTRLPMQSGHHVDAHSSDHHSGSSDKEQSDRPKLQTSSDASPQSASLTPGSEDDSGSDSDSKSPPAEACKESTNEQEHKHNHQGQSNTKARQEDEQTNQNHQQNDPEDEKRCLLATYVWVVLQALKVVFKSWI